MSSAIETLRALQLGTGKAVFWGDVLVVGAEESGLQAALDLGDMGLRVYVVDRSPAKTIDSKTSQSSQAHGQEGIWPSAQYIKCLWHPNIHILAHTEAVNVQGHRGAFRIIVQPRSAKADPTCSTQRKIRTQAIEVNVAGIVLAPALESFDPSAGIYQGYRQYRNVVTGKELEEQFLTPNSPESSLQRLLSSGKPLKIAWIQCAGSRQPVHGGRRYCSAECCSLSLQQVLAVKMQAPAAECIVFHNDIRPCSMHGEELYQKAKGFIGVHFLRCYPLIVKEEPKNGKIALRYAPWGKHVREELFDRVVLAVGGNPPADVSSLSGIFGITLNRYGFCATNAVDPFQTTRPGVFACGPFLGPMSSSQALATASGAAARCAETLSLRYRRGDQPVFQERRQTSEEKPKIGIFVCNCQGHAKRRIDIPYVVDYVRTLPNVAHAEECSSLCSPSQGKRLAQVISENDINRVIVAACSPLISADVISWELGSQGFDVSCLEMANIREHCAWVHHGQGQAVTDKAVDILRMSVVRAQYHGSWEGQEQQTDKRILVVGSGITGLNSALCLAKLGFEVSLVEKESQLGGIARKIHSTIEGLDVQTYLQDLISKVHNLPNIQIYSRAEILEHNGAAGCFKAVIASDKGTREISYGASIIATGAVPVSPTQYLYGQDERVMTNLELEEHLHRGNKAVMQAENLVFIQCIGRRNHDRPYCSQICCSHSLKNVLQLKKNDPGKKIWILYQDMMTPGFLEEYSLQAAQKDVGFICYHPQNPPEIKKLKKGTRSELRVRIKDRVLDRTVELKADILALAVALVPGRGTEEATRLFHIPVHSHGFARKAESGLLPVDSWAEGVFICGMMNGPQCIPHAIYEAYAAAGRAAAFLAPDRLVYQNPVAVVDEQKCIGCGACISICAYGAIEWVETSYGKKARVLPGLCKGDGLCNTVCPSKAIAVNAFSDKQIEHQIKAAL